jgi:DivIVA domain-containing protein
MDEDDPEKRIAELERRLAQERDAVDPRANQASGTSGGWLTSEQVRDVAFSKPRAGKRGYNEDEVDAFLNLVEEHLRSRRDGLSPPPHAGFAAPPASQPPPRSEGWIRRLLGR